MKKIGKFLLALIILLSSVISNFVGIGTKAEAATFFVNEANLKEKTIVTDTITYNGIEIDTTYVYYIKDGVEYPAYCISPGADGVGEYGSYTVSVDSLLNDAKLWRVITNGYPYKSVAELGCKSAEEAFVATKHAVYCAMLGREASWYGSLGAKGDRVKNAMAQILAAADSSTSGKPSSNIEIIEKSGDWKVDVSSPKFVSKTFAISASTTYNTYNVSLEGNYPAETTILDTNNSPKTTFSSGEQFKIAIPLGSLNNNGSFKIKVATKLNTKPVLYGKAPVGTGLQDYALAASIYEDAEGIKTINYSKNDTKVEIIKKDEKTLKPLKGVEFRILNSNKKPVYTDLITNAQGKVEVTGLTPGKYYLEEVKGLDGYVKYDKLIEFDIAYNQSLTINVNNTLEKNVEKETNTQTINVTQNKENILIKNNEETVTKTGNEKSTTIVDSVKNVTENEDIAKEIKSNIINDNNSNSSTSEKLSNLSLDNKNENYNKLATKLRTIIDNENINVNKSLLDQYLKLDNKNSNLNENIQNLLANILNVNDNKNLNTQNENINIGNENNDKNINTQNNNLNIKNKNDKLNANVQNNNQNIETNIQSSNINISNQNNNTNTQTAEKNISINNQNNNTNISSYNGIVKLPKTGM